MAQQWFKFYGAEYLSDPKIERLSPLERSCWLTILCMASMSTDGIIEFLTVESLLNRSGIQFDPYHPEEWERALSVFVKFKNLKMIDTSEDGQITVKNWSKRQEHNLTVAERVAKSRKNKRDVTINVTNVTTDKNRIDKNKYIHTGRTSEIPSASNTKMAIYKTDSREFADSSEEVVNEEGEPVIKSLVQKKPKTPWDQKLYFKEVLDNEHSLLADKILVVFCLEKKMKLDNKAQYQAVAYRYKKVAQKIADLGYTAKQISKAFKKVNKFEYWTLETVLKVLPEYTDDE